MSQTITIGTTHVELSDTLAGFAQRDKVKAALVEAEVSLQGIAAWIPAQLDPAELPPLIPPIFAQNGLAPILRALTQRLYDWTGDWPAGAPGYGYIELDLVNRFIANLKAAMLRLDQDRKALAAIFFGRFGAAYDIASLDHVYPLRSESQIQGREVLLLEFTLQARPDQIPTVPPSVKAKLVYKPADVEVDCFLLGDTSTLGLDAHGRYVSPAYSSDKLAPCPSVAEIFNDRSGEADALPTYVVWPAVTGAQSQEKCGQQPAQGKDCGYQFQDQDACCQGNCPFCGPYGYVEYLEHNVEQRLIKDKKQAEVFYRCFGRLVSLAFVFCLDDVYYQNVLVHRQRPYFIDLESSFTKPFARLDDTQIFDRERGPLFAKINALAPNEPPTPCHVPYRLLEGKPDALRLVEPRHYASELREGCEESLKVLGQCAKKIEARLGQTPKLRTRAMFMQAADYRKLFGEVLKKLSGAQTYGKLEVVDAIAEAEFDLQRGLWTRAWFDKVLADVQTLLDRLDKSQARDKPIAATLKTFKDELCKAARVSNFNQVTGQKLWDASELQLPRCWERLLVFADYLSRLASLAPYDPGIKDSWDILPTFALKPQAAPARKPTPSPDSPLPASALATIAKLPPLIAAPLPECGPRPADAPPPLSAPDFADYRKFGVPFYCRQVNDAELRDARGRVVTLPGVENPPVPPAMRNSFFPHPIGPIVMQRVHSASRLGFQHNLLTQIARLMG